jgi:predicted TIM-barrel fold metal-dependent hydrolase
MREIIDFHIHPFYNTGRNVCFYDNTINSVEDIKKDLQRAGISRACGSVIERMESVNFSKIRALNDEALVLRDKMDGFYIPGIHIHPGYVTESIAELERMNDNGVRLVGELVPYMMGWESYYDDNMDKLYGVINELDMVVSLHTISEESIDEAVSRFPHINFVAAHPGDKAQLLRHIERLKKYPNYHLDLSGTGIFRYGLIGYLVSQVGSERLLFGTDYPICNPGLYVEAVLFERLGEEDYNNILSDNAKRLLGLE